MLPHRRLFTSPLAALAVVLFAAMAAFAGLQWRDAERQVQAAAAEKRLALERQGEADRAREDAERRREEAERRRSAAEADQARRDEALRAAEQERDAERVRAAEAGTIAASGRAAFAARGALGREDPLLAAVTVAKAIKAGAPVGWEKTPDLSRMLVASHRDLGLRAAFKGSFVRTALSWDGGTIGLLSADALTFRDVATGEARSKPLEIKALVDPAPDDPSWGQDVPERQLQLVLSETGARAAVRAGDKVVLFVRDGGQGPDTVPCPGFAGPLLFLDEARLLMTCGSQVTVYGADRRQALYSFDLGDDWAGNYLGLGAQSVDYSRAARLIATPREVREAETGSVVFTVATGERGTLGRAAVSFSPDGGFLAVDDESTPGSIKTQIWDVRRKEKAALIEEQAESAPPVVLADHDQAIVQASAGNLSVQQLVMPAETSPDEWQVYTSGMRLLSNPTPFRRDLVYERSYFMPEAKAALFVASEDAEIPTYGVAVFARDHGFRVFRGKVEPRMDLKNGHPDGLFVTRDEDYAYVWRSSHARGNAALPGEAAGASYATRSGTYVTRDQICSEAPQCRPFKPGDSVFVLADGRVRSTERADDRIRLTDEEGRELAAFELGPETAGFKRQSEGTETLTGDGRCLATRFYRLDGERREYRVLVWRTDGNRERLVDITQKGEVSDVDLAVGSQLFLAGPNGRVRVDCGTGQMSELDRLADVTATGNGSLVKIMRQEEVRGVPTPTAIEIHDAGSFNLLGRIEAGSAPDELFRVDVEQGGRRYLRDGKVHSFPDGTLLASLSPVHRFFRFLPGRNAILATRSESYGQRLNATIIDGLTYEPMLDLDEPLRDAEPVTFGPGLRFLATGLPWATEMPDLKRAQEEVSALNERLDLSGIK